MPGVQLTCEDYQALASLDAPHRYASDHVKNRMELCQAAKSVLHSLEGNGSITASARQAHSRLSICYHQQNAPKTCESPVLSSRASNTALSERCQPSPSQKQPKLTLQATRSSKDVRRCAEHPQARLLQTAPAVDSRTGDICRVLQTTLRVDIGNIKCTVGTRMLLGKHLHHVARCRLQSWARPATRQSTTSAACTPTVAFRMLCLGSQSQQARSSINFCCISCIQTRPRT